MLEAFSLIGGIGRLDDFDVGNSGRGGYQIRRRGIFWEVPGEQVVVGGVGS